MTILKINQINKEMLYDIIEANNLNDSIKHLSFLNAVVCNGFTYSFIGDNKIIAHKNFKVFKIYKLYGWYYSSFYGCDFHGHYNITTMIDKTTETGFYWKSKVLI